MKKNISKSGVEKNSVFMAKKLTISEDSDLITIRKYGREMTAQLGYSRNDQTLIVTALSEICRNILEYAGEGEVLLGHKLHKRRRCISITAVDFGPGIDNIDSALKEGFTTGKGMGMGLPGTKRIMDEFEVESTGGGTVIKMCKWLKY